RIAPDPPPPKTVGVYHEQKLLRFNHIPGCRVIQKSGVKMEGTHFQTVNVTYEAIGNGFTLRIPDPTTRKGPRNNGKHKAKIEAVEATRKLIHETFGRRKDDPPTEAAAL